MWNFRRAQLQPPGRPSQPTNLSVAEVAAAELDAVASGGAIVTGRDVLRSRVCHFHLAQTEKLDTHRTDETTPAKFRSLRSEIQFKDNSST